MGSGPLHRFRSKTTSSPPGTDAIGMTRATAHATNAILYEAGVFQVYTEADAPVGGGVKGLGTTGAG
jgi:hypothetical protein